MAKDQDQTLTSEEQDKKDEAALLLMFFLSSQLIFQDRVDAYVVQSNRAMGEITTAGALAIEQAIEGNIPADHENGRYSRVVLHQIDALTLGLQAILTGHIIEMASQAGAASYQAYNRMMSLDGNWRGFKAVTKGYDTVKDTLIKATFGGKTIKQWVESTFIHELKERIFGDLDAERLDGNNIQDVIGRLMDGFDTIKKQGVPMLNNFFAFSAVKGALGEIFAANDIKEVQWNITPGNNCARCLALHGNVYKQDQHPDNPLHINCACILIPLLNKRLAELGLDADKLNAMTDPDMRRRIIESRVNQDTLSMTRIAPLIGPSRAALIKSGKVTLTQLVDRDTGRLLLLNELPDLK